VEGFPLNTPKTRLKNSPGTLSNEFSTLTLTPMRLSMSVNSPIFFGAEGGSAEIAESKADALGTVSAP
jgi:hypothetical protein